MAIARITRLAGLRSNLLVMLPVCKFGLSLIEIRQVRTVWKMEGPVAGTPQCLAPLVGIGQPLIFPSANRSAGDDWSCIYVSHACFWRRLKRRYHCITELPSVSICDS